MNFKYPAYNLSHLDSASERQQEDWLPCSSQEGVQSGTTAHQSRARHANSICQAPAALDITLSADAQSAGRGVAAGWL